MSAQAFRLTTLIFDSAKDQWIPAPQPTSAIPLARSLSLVTWNVWFGVLEWQLRQQVLLDIVEKLNPDVIALQEVTPRFLDVLLKTKWVQQKYHIPDSKDMLGDYGCVILSRFPATFDAYNLPTNLGRYYLVGQIHFEEHTIDIGTVHLESMKGNSMKRAQQLNIIFGLENNHRKPTTSVIMGDFNLCSTWPENSVVDKSWVDIWPAVHTKRPGWTEDTDINLMRKDAEFGRVKLVRFDRVLVKSPQYKAARIKLLGTDAINSTRIFPSDHFGLHSIVSL